MNYIIGEITCPFELRYDFFKEDYECDYDKFISFRSDAYFALTDNNLEKAKISLDSAMNLFKDDPDLVRMFGTYYLKISDYENAEVHFKHLIEIAPKEIDGYLNRGFLFLKLSKINEAYYDFEEALNLYPDNLQALKGLAKCYYELNKLLESKLLYEQVSEECPYDIDAKMSIIEINVKLMKKYKADLTNNPTSLNIIYKLADTYFQLDYFEKCYEFIKNADKFSVLNSELYLLLANASSKINNKKEALKYLDKALAIAYNEGKNGYDILFKLGVVNYELKNFKESLEDHKIVLYNKSNFSDAWYRKGYCHLQLSQYSEAISSFKTAIDWGTDYTDINLHLALCHFKLENFKAAIRCIKHHCIYLFRNRVSKLLPFLGSKGTSKENWPFENPPKYNSLPHLNVSIGGNYAKNL